MLVACAAFGALHDSVSALTRSLSQPQATSCQIRGGAEGLCERRCWARAERRRLCGATPPAPQGATGAEMVDGACSQTTPSLTHGQVVRTCTVAPFPALGLVAVGPNRACQRATAHLARECAGFGVVLVCSPARNGYQELLAV